MPGVRWKCGWGNEHGNAKNLGRNPKNVGNQGDDVRNQGVNLSIAVEITQNSNGNDKFKEWREVKIIENEHICENLVSHI